MTPRTAILPGLAALALFLVPACTLGTSRKEAPAEDSRASLRLPPGTKDKAEAGGAPVAATSEAEVDAAAAPEAKQMPRPLPAPRTLAAPARKGRAYGGPAGAAASVRAAPAPMPGRMPEQAWSDEEVPRSEAFNTEAYARIRENPFLAARANPLSTFSIDVDAASYANVRRYLIGNQLPPPDAVRIEEVINYFDYDYPRPRGDAPFSITTEVAATPWNAKTRLVHVGLQGVAVDNARLPAGNLVFLVDVSGSMESPEKLPLLKRAFRLLVDQLRPQDKVSLVVYAGAAGVVLPPTSGRDKAAILEALERLSAGGSTAGGEGLLLAYKTAREGFIAGGNNRIILATDGDFNVGVSSDAEMERLVERERKSGVALSVLGFGMGNYKDSKMEVLADKGDGNYAYIDNVREARKVLVEEMGGTLLTIAKDVKIQVEFNPARVEAYRLVGYENRLLAAEDFNDDTKDAGELGAGHSVTALYEVVPAGTGMGLPGTDPLKYQGPADGAAGEASGELLTVKFRYKEPGGVRSKLITRTLVDGGLAWREASADFRFSAAAAGFGLLLRGSEHKGTLDWARVLELARGAAGADPKGHRAEFIRLAEAARDLGEAAPSRRLGSRAP